MLMRFEERGKRERREKKRERIKRAAFGDLKWPIHPPQANVNVRGRVLG